MENFIDKIIGLDASFLFAIIYLISFISLVLCFVFSCIVLLKSRAQVSILKQEKKELFSKKRSTEVRTGHIVEKFAPFLDDFPYDPENAVFLGKPIDYLVFEDDMVRFLEVKSGGAPLNKKQRGIRNLIKDKKVSFETLRITDSDIELKTHEDTPTVPQKKTK